MAHNLENKNGKTSFVAVGEKAWHGLGTYVDNAMTAAQAIELGGLNFTVAKKEIQMVDGAIIPDFRATYRTDTGDPLGIVTDAYHIIQNVDAFEFFDTIIDRGEAIYQTAGVLGKGEKIFISAKLPADITVKGETIEQYLLFTTGHDGRTPTQVGFSGIRVVCNNTLLAALRALSNSVTVYHYKNAQQKLNEAAKVMGMASTYSKELETIFNRMAAVKITDKKLRAYIESVMKPRTETINKETMQAEYSTRFVNTVDDIMEFSLHHDTQKGKATKNTVWGAYNGISGYFGYLKNYKSQDEKMSDIYLKNGAKKIELAFDLAHAMI